MLIQELKEILQDLNDKFLSKFFWSFHQPKLMCHFSDTNNDIHLNLLFFKALQTRFTCM